MPEEKKVDEEVDPKEEDLEDEILDDELEDLDDEELETLVEEGEAKTFEEKDFDDPEKRKAALDLLTKAQSVLKQRAIWKRRAIDSGYGKTPEVSVDPKAKPPAAKNTPAKNDAALDEVRRSNERTEFRLDHPDLPRRMIDEIEKFARANGMTLEKTMRSPLIKRFVNDKEEKERLSKASPTSRHRSPQTAPPVDWAKATPEAVAEHAAKARQANANRQR